MIDPELSRINKVVVDELQRRGKIKISLILENRAKVVTFSKIVLRKDFLPILDILTSNRGVKIGIKQK